jgi:hypothetical protein
MLKDQQSVSQNFNSTSSIVNFNKKNNPQIDAFIRKKSFETPVVVSKRGDIFGQNNQTKNVLKPSLYVNNSTRKSTGADLANARPSFRKSNPVRYYSDFTIISAIENAHRSGKFHLDAGSIERLKDYLRENDKEPNKNIDNVPDILPTPKIIPYTPDAPSPITPMQKPQEIPDSDPGILPTPPPPSNWKGRLKTAAKWAGILAAVGGFGAMTYNQLKGLFQMGNNNEINPDPFGVWENDGVQPDPNLPQYEPYNPDEALLEDIFNGDDRTPGRPPAQNPNLYHEADVDLADFSSGDDESLENILGRAIGDIDEKHDEPDEENVARELFNNSDYARVTQINERKNYRDENYFNIDKLRNGIHTDINNNPNLSNEEKLDKIQEWLHRRDRKKRADLLEYENSEGKSIVQILWDKGRNAFTTPPKPIKKPASKNPKTPRKPRKKKD